MTVSQKEDLHRRAKETGVSPSEIVRRALQGPPPLPLVSQSEAQNFAEDLKRDLTESFKKSVFGISPDQLSIALDSARQKKLAKLAKDFGLDTPEELLKDLALRALADPKKAEEFLFSEVRAMAKEHAKRATRGKQAA